MFKGIVFHCDPLLLRIDIRNSHKIITHYFDYVKFLIVIFKAAFGNRKTRDVSSNILTPEQVFV